MEFECSIVVDKHYKVQNMMKKDLRTYLGLWASMVSLVQLEKKVLQPPYFIYI
jgi:deoxyadenosine/deoxycytidine kinase